MRIGYFLSSEEHGPPAFKVYEHEVLPELRRAQED